MNFWRSAADSGVEVSRSFYLASLAVLSVLAAVIILQPFFVFALVQGRSHVDLAAIRTHLLQAFEAGVLDDGQEPRLYINRAGHQWTECTTWNMALDDQAPIAAALLPRLHFDGIDPCVDLHQVVAGIPAPVMTDYSRYWHGYRVYMWPLLDHFSLQSARFVNALVLLGVLAFFYWALRRAIGPTPALVFFVVLMSLTDIWRIWVITAHFVSMSVILAGSAAFAVLRQKTANACVLLTCAAAFGSIFNFVDFLVNPPMMPMLLSFFMLAALDDVEIGQRGRVLKVLVPAIMVAAAWFAGYAMTWFTKWILFVLLSADPLQAFNSIISQMELRTYGQEPDGHIYFVPLLASSLMIVQSFISAGSVIVAVLAAAIVLHLRNNWQAFDKRKFLLLWLPTLIPTAWFELLNNHTQRHSHFTYRSEAAAIAVVFAVAIMATNAPTNIGALLENLRRSLPRLGDARAP